MHQMAGFDKEKAIETFCIPIGYEPIAVMALGYLGNPDLLNDELKNREIEERPRKEFDEFVFTEKFGNKTKFFPKHM